MEPTECDSWIPGCECYYTLTIYDGCSFKGPCKVKFDYPNEHPFKRSLLGKVHPNPDPETGKMGHKWPIVGGTGTAPKEGQ